MAHVLKLFFIIFGLLLTENTYAQSIGGLTELDKYVQKARIGLVDEFMDRFNGKSSHPEILNLKNNVRKNNILMAFDLAMFSSKKDSLFVEAEKFADVVVKNNVRLNYADTTWCAKAPCVGTLNGRRVKLTIYLTVQSRGKDMYKWVISKIDADFLGVKPFIDKEVMLYPDDHETNFMSLGHITTEQPRNIVKFIRKGFSYNPLSAFSYLVYNKALKIDHVEGLEFVFTQVPGYNFSIKYYEREKNNAGWLISSFKRVKNKDKRMFFDALYGCAKGLPSDSLDKKSVNTSCSDNNEATKVGKQNHQAKVQATTNIGKDMPLADRIKDFLKDVGGVYCFLLDPMSSDTVAYINGNEPIQHFEVLSSDSLSTEASEALIATLIYPKSFVDDGYVKDCVFLPDVEFVIKKKNADDNMSFAYSFYCDVCKFICHGEMYTYNGENIRQPILQIVEEVFPKDRYVRRIAGKTR